MKTTSLCAFLLSALLVGCSSDSDNPGTTTPDNLTQDDQTITDETLTPEDQSTVMDAGNYEPLLTASMDVLRAEVYNRTYRLMSELESSWSGNTNIEVGTTVAYDCEGEGMLSRVITLQTFLELDREATKCSLSTALTDSNGQQTIIEREWLAPAPL